VNTNAFPPAKTTLEQRTGRHTIVRGGLPGVFDLGVQSVTGKRPNERDLRQSESRYRRLFEAAQDGILILDAETGRIVDVNPFLLSLLGATHEEAIGKTVGELSPFKDTIPNREMLDRLKSRGYVRYDDLPLETRDGRRIAVEFVSNSYEVGDRTVIQCNIRDITERKKADQHLLLLSACVSNLNDVFMVTEAGPIDEPGPRIVFVNEAFERNTGYKSAEAIGRSPRFLQGEHTDPTVLAEIRSSLERRQPIKRQLINYRKDGTPFWVDVDIVPIVDRKGTCSHFAAIQRDVTAEKQNQARFRHLVDSNAQSVLFWNTDGQVTDANEAFLALTHFSREDIRRGAVSWAGITPPEYARADKQSLAEMSAKGTCEPYEKELLRKDGSRVPILVGAALFADNPHEGFSFVLDLTEKKKLERQFLRAQRMESIGTLAGGIAHDLNNILAPILMSIELLQMRSPDPESSKILATIELSARRGADIVRQVLSFARGVDGKRVEIQPKHLLSDIEAIIKDTFPRDIRLHFTVPADAWTILGDPTQINQILMNLCVNARDAMPDGGTLAVTVENCLLDDTSPAMSSPLKAGHYVKIRVVDSGTGIPQEVIDKIFEPFFTTKDLSKGTGLGLSTVLAIVKSHGGGINVYSERGRGSTFTVYLPAGSVLLSPPEKTTESPGLPRGKGELVLVVDDEDAILLITSQTLLAFGYRVLTATDGAEAVALYAQYRNEIALVLTDMMMPIMGGLAEIHALRRLNPSVKIVTASGLNETGPMAGARSSPTRGFLMKPYSSGTLLTTIRQVLDRR